MILFGTLNYLRDFSRMNLLSTNNMAINGLLLFMMSLILSSCEMASDHPSDPVLARVGESALTLQQALKEIPDLLLVKDSLSAIEQFQTTWIQNQVIRKEAERIGLDRNADMTRRMERLREQLLRNAITDYVISQHSEELAVSREEAQNYYQSHKDNFILDEEYIRFRHLTTRTLGEAESARNDLLGSVSWSDVTQRYSVNPDRQFRESERFWPVTMAVSDIPIMNHYLANVIGIREISPIQVHGGLFHFVQLMESRPEGDHPDLEWLIEQITEWLRLEKTQRLVNSYIRNLYLQAEANNEIERLAIDEIEWQQESNRNTQ